MKKALKITGITLASIIGLALIVVVVALAMVTSSGRLTKMVKKYAPQFVNCEMQLGKADLTLFKTFPNVGVDIENVALINPMEGSPSDTLANIDNLIVVIDAKKFLKEKEIAVCKCILEDAFVNLYTDSIGNSNLNVFNTKEDNDTTKSTFDYLVDIEEVKLVEIFCKTKTVSVFLQRSDSLLECFLICLADAHDFAYGSHLCAELILSSVELLECPSCKLDYDIVAVRIVLIECAVLAAGDLIECKTACEHSGYQSDRETCCLGSES